MKTRSQNRPHCRLFKPALLLCVCLQQPVSAWGAQPQAGALSYTAYSAEARRARFPARSPKIARGNLYIANEAGLLRFDGEHWSLLPASGQTAYVSSVAVDARERIWITSPKSIGYYARTTRGSHVYQDMTDSLRQLPDSADFGTFWKLYAHEEQLYLITTRHVLRWDGSRWDSWSFPEQRRLLPSWIDDTLYIHARGSGLFRFNEDAFELIADDSPGSHPELSPYSRHPAADFSAPHTPTAFSTYRTVSTKKRHHARPGFADLSRPLIA